MLLPILPKARGNFRMRKQEADLVGRSFNGMRQQASVFVNDLGRDAADSRSHHRFFLPQSFRDGQSEAFAKALLQNYSRSALQGVHFQWRGRGKLDYVAVGLP